MKLMRILRHPRAAVIVHDLVMVGISWLAAGWIINRTGFAGILDSVPLVTELLLVLAVQGVVLWFTGLYKGLWRFASFPDLWNIVRAAAFGTFSIAIVLTVFYGPQARTVLGPVLIYPALLFLTLGLPRMCFRFWKDSRSSGKPGSVACQACTGAGRRTFRGDVGAGTAPPRCVRCGGVPR